MSKSKKVVDHSNWLLFGFGFAIAFFFILPIINNHWISENKFENMAADRTNQKDFCKALGFSHEYGVNNHRKFGCETARELISYNDLKTFCQLKEKNGVSCK